MSRNDRYLSTREYWNLSDEARSTYIQRLFEEATQDEDLEVDPVEDQNEGNVSYTGEVSESENEDLNVDNANEIAAAIDAPEEIFFDDESEDDDMQEDAPTTNPADYMTARDGTQWQRTPRSCQQVRSHNIFRDRCGPARITENMTPLQCFKSYLTVEMVDIIVRHTNRKAHATYNAYNEENPNRRQLKWKDTTINEIYAFIGMVLMAGTNHSNDENARDLWTSQAHPIFRATMGINRFFDLLRFMRFDDPRTRVERQRQDKAAPIRDIWIMLNANLARYYVPSEYLTIDEQLYPFRGRTKFTQYIPSKPAKYGIKVWWICDAKNSYPLHGQIYTGQQETGREVGVGERVVRDLVGPYYGSGRNITMDNFFTTLPLARQLKVEKLSIVGTLRHNKAYIPAEMKEDKKKDVGSSLFGFYDNVTLLSYKQRKSKSVILLSSMHDDAQIDENGKPEIINFYNQTKGGVDVMDQTLQEYTTQRQTRRWPMAFFYNIIDVSAFASHIIYYGNNPTARYTTTRRKNFLRQLAENLCIPVIENRISNVQSVRQFSTKNAIESIIGRPLESVLCAAGPSTSPSARQRGRKVHTGVCYMCKLLPNKRRRKTRKNCSICSTPICDEHAITITKCYNCHNNNDSDSDEL